MLSNSDEYNNLMMETIRQQSLKLLLNFAYAGLFINCFTHQDARNTSDYRKIVVQVTTFTFNSKVNRLSSPVKVVFLSTAILQNDVLGLNDY
jgi:hypothetical protein